MIICCEYYIDLYLESDEALMVIANNYNNDETRYTYEILLLLVFLQVVTRSNFRPQQKYRIDFVLYFLVYGELQSWHQKQVYLNRGKDVTKVTTINTWNNNENCLEDEGRMTIVPYYPCVTFNIIFWTHSNIDFTIIFLFQIRRRRNAIRCWLGIFAQITQRLN